MSADESALLAAVAADPASDLPRLVYADWLDDHGQPLRAEFIRLQCEIARLEVGPRAVVDANWRLWKRQQDLLDDHLSELLGPAAFLADDRLELERGFVSAVTLHVSRFQNVAAELVAPPLLPRVAVTHLAADFLGFFASPAVGCVAELRVHDREAMWGDPGLMIADAFRDNAGRLTRLVTLDFDRCDFTDVAAESLSEGRFPALQHLILSNCYLTDAGVVKLLTTGLPQRLTRLVLDGNPLTDQAAFELADRLAPVKTFRTLDFRRTHVTSAGQAALTAAFGSRCNLF